MLRSFIYLLCMSVLFTSLSVAAFVFGEATDFMITIGVICGVIALLFLFITEIAYRWWRQESMGTEEHEEERL